MSEATPNTLFELLKKYKVEIPKVQRDYAQGRHDEHAEMVRKNLLDDMKSAIQGETDPLDLNFVYGKAEENKFIPIDGQQRLTTLFLLYLYAFRDDESKTELLKKFSYNTRISSRNFLEELIKRRKSVFRDEAEPLPSKEIEDSEWFVSGWRYDPTIQSALTMLDGIKAVFSDVKNLAQRLSDEKSKPITFEFLDMKDLGMEDSLYIKLNARGKQLEPLENFKARLIGQLRKLDMGEKFEKDFTIQFDGKWTDLFWSNDKNNFDKAYLLFFGVLLMNKGKGIDDDNWSNRLEYENIGTEIFETAFHTLNFLVANTELNEIQQRVFNKIKQLIFNAVTEKRTYKDRVLFHAVTVYMYSTKGNQKESLEQWIRIIQNLTLNSQIDTQERYQNAIDEINKLTEHLDNPLEYFSKDGKPAFFNQKQIAEEQKKARIILQNKDFAEEIYKAEQHPYFSGQIRSALYYAISENTSMEVFLRYWRKISELFNDKEPKHGHFLRRALLAFGDYTLPAGGKVYRTLCVNDPNEAASTPSLKQLFSDQNEVAKKLLDALTFPGNIGEQLETFIKNSIKDSTVPKNSWRYCFINFPGLFKKMSDSHLRLRWVDGKELIMMPNKESTGYNYGVFLYALYESLIPHGMEPILDGEYGAWGDRYLCVKELQVRFKNGKFIITDSVNKVVFETETEDPIADAVKYLTEGH